MRVTKKYIENCSHSLYKKYIVKYIERIYRKLVPLHPSVVCSPTGLMRLFDRHQSAMIIIQNTYDFVEIVSIGSHVFIKKVSVRPSHIST